VVAGVAFTAVALVAELRADRIAAGATLAIVAFVAFAELRADRIAAGAALAPVALVAELLGDRTGPSPRLSWRCRRQSGSVEI
jgi:hypothetical protein